MARKWAYLMIHHTATAPTLTVADIDRMHRQRGYNGVGYHYLIQRDREGKAYLKAGRSDTQIGAHAGVNKYNREALGLSVIGYFHPGSEHSEHVGDQLFADIVAAVCHLCKTYGIPADNAHILYHRDVRSTACPGDWFPAKATLIQAVRKALGK